MWSDSEKKLNSPFQHTCTHTNMHPCTRTHTHMHITHKCVLISSTHIYKCALMYMHIHTHIHIHTHKYAATHGQAHTHTHVHTLMMVRYYASAKCVECGLTFQKSCRRLVPECVTRQSSVQGQPCPFVWGPGRAGQSPEETWPKCSHVLETHIHM